MHNEANVVPETPVIFTDAVHNGPAAVDNCLFRTTTTGDGRWRTHVILSQPMLSTGLIPSLCTTVDGVIATPQPVIHRFHKCYDYYQRVEKWRFAIADWGCCCEHAHRPARGIPGRAMSCVMSEAVRSAPAGHGEPGQVRAVVRLPPARRTRRPGVGRSRMAPNVRVHAPSRAA